MLSSAAVLSLVLGASAAAQPALSPERQAKFEKLHAVLDYGLWNDRVDALYDLEGEGADGLPLLVYANEDADYQVRLTAVQFLGKVGPPAVTALRDVVNREPCPYVRFIAMWVLSRTGPSGRAMYEALATPDDEENIAALPKHYTPDMMGRPLTIDAPFEMSKSFFNGGIDARLCKSSEHAGRLHGRWRPRPGGPTIHERVPTPEVPDSARQDLTPAQRKARAAAGGAAAARPPRVTPEQRERDEELDSLLVEQSTAAASPRTGARFRSALAGAEAFAAAAAKSLKAFRSRASDSTASTAAVSSGTRRARPGEVLPLGPAAPDGPAHLEPGSPFYEASDQRALASASIAASTGTRTRRPGESMPSSVPILPEPPAEGAGTADFVADAGTGKIENDPIPVLIAQLKSPEPRRRFRAADELGRRGGLAGQAIPALRRALRDKDRRVRSSAALALGGIGGVSDGLLADLKRAQRDKNEDVRFSAALALERLAKLR